MSKRLVIAGAGGFGRGVYSWLRQSPRHLERYQVDDIVFIDDAVPGIQRILPVVGTIRDYMPRSGDEALVAIGVPAIRKKIVEHLKYRRARFHTFVDDRVVIGDNVRLGAGTIVCPGTVISADASLGTHVHVNFNCSVGHDVIIGDFTTLSPMGNIMGETLIGSEVFVGGSAVVMPRISVADGTTVGAGATVTKTVDEVSTIAGNPARDIRTLTWNYRDKRA